MKRLLLALTLTLSLGGCMLPTMETLRTAIQFGTATVDNPVTPTRLNQMESAFTIVVAGLQAWKTSCAKGLINVDCKDQIGAVQVYTRQIPPYMQQLRGFVRANDQINATKVFNLVSDLIAKAKSQAASAGQSIGG